MFIKRFVMKDGWKGSDGVDQKRVQSKTMEEEEEEEVKEEEEDRIFEMLAGSSSLSSLSPLSPLGLLVS